MIAIKERHQQIRFAFGCGGNAPGQDTYGEGVGSELKWSLAQIIERDGGGA